MNEKYKKELEVERRLVRATYTVGNTTMEIGKADIQHVQTHTFDLFVHGSLKPRHFTTGIAAAAIILTGYCLEKKYGLVSRVIGRGSVIYEVVFPKASSALLETLFNERIIEDEMKKVFEDVETSLKNLGYGDVVDELNANLPEEFAGFEKVRLKSLEILDSASVKELAKAWTESEEAFGLPILVTSDLKLKWEGRNVKVDAGGKFSADIDVAAVTGALAAVGTAVGSAVDKDAVVKFLVGASAASVGTYFVVRSIQKIWPWIEAKISPQNGLLQVSVPDKKKCDLDRLLDGGKMEKNLQLAVQDPRRVIRNDIGDTLSETTMGDIAAKLENLHLSSLTKCNDGSGNAVGTYVEGTITVKSTNQVEIIKAGNGTGNTIGKHIAKGATGEFVTRGGIVAIGAVSDSVLNKAIEENAGNKISVSVMFSDGSKKFKGRFAPDATIYDVISQINEKMKPKHVKHIAEIEKQDVRLKVTTTISTLQDKDQLDELIAILE